MAKDIFMNSYYTKLVITCIAIIATVTITYHIVSPLESCLRSNTDLSDPLFHCAKTYGLSW
jgi:hypothetical protein